MQIEKNDTEINSFDGLYYMPLLNYGNILEIVGVFESQ